MIGKFKILSLGILMCMSACVVQDRAPTASDEREVEQDFGSDPDGDVQYTEVELTVYHTLPGYADDDVENALNHGATWEEIEEEGLIEIEQMDSELVPVLRFEDGEPINTMQSRTLKAFQGVYYVSAGSTVNLSYDAASSTCYYLYGLGAKSYSSPYTAIGASEAKADYFKYVSGAWEWKDNDFSSSSGEWSANMWCGSDCTKLRNKVNNRTSSTTHDYISYLYYDSASACGH